MWIGFNKRFMGDCACLYIYIYIYIYRERERERETLLFFFNPFAVTGLRLGRYYKGIMVLLICRMNSFNICCKL